VGGEIGGIEVHCRPGQKHKTLSENKLKAKGLRPWLKWWYKSLSSISSTAKKRFMRKIESYGAVLNIKRAPSNLLGL
jgi:hypothetical protein